MMNKDRAIVQIALYAAVIAVLGFLAKINLPIAGGVPITAQSLGVMLAGVMLGSKRGGLASLLFIFVVALGAPFLAGGRGGLGVFQGPTVGFIIGFPVASFVTGFLMEKFSKTPVFPAALIASIGGGVIALYGLGIPGLALMTDLSLLGAFKAVMVFIPGDVIKAVLVALLAQAVARGLPSALLSRR